MSKLFLRTTMFVGAIAVSLTGLPAAQAEEPAIGLFHACYQVGGGMPGAPMVHLNVVVNTPSQSVNGSALITQAVNPPLNDPSDVSGNYSVMTVMPNNTHIQVRLTGYPPFQRPPISHSNIAILPNLEMIMVLSKDWSGGEAQYQYRTGLLSDPVKISSAKVQSVACNSVH